ncbi:site-specific DNA-methyltransferase [Fibrella rubiginis]|uniref:site-specific DNA-methyltransferase n=1 Tax=Fibrella rubiginis TaxID=2817060 RepID=UPI001E4B46C7|nr:site-specific DNA-methyltransferase [Fibrella rubiginis]
MPTLNWIGKDKVINHHLDVPFRTLDAQYTFQAGPRQAKESAATALSDNLIIHGDNLEALKALLPRYEGQVRCIYIDPPYNTGNEGWVYNDNVNDPKIKRWLNSVVGKEGEDLSRHDKWLCMMYPRLKLLHKLLAEDGVIFISIDDNEVQNLRPILDEIFGGQNRIEQFIWKKSYGGGAKERYAVTVHEYVLMYAKSKDKISELTLPPDPDAEARYYKLTHEKLAIRGPFRIKPLEATKSMDRRENLIYPIPAPDGTEVWPKRQWWWAKERAYSAVENNDLYFIKAKDGAWSISYKQYLRDDTGEERRSKPFSIIDGIYNQVGSAALRELFADRGQNVFQFPKPVELIEKLLSMLQLSADAIILDSFAGSGTTAHAVENLNRQDGGKRKFILVEMEDYAETITAERVKRVMKSNFTPPPLTVTNN